MRRTLLLYSAATFASALQAGLEHGVRAAAIIVTGSGVILAVSGAITVLYLGRVRRKTV